jgi:hypothetical protein
MFWSKKPLITITRVVFNGKKEEFKTARPVRIRTRDYRFIELTMKSYKGRPKEKRYFNISDVFAILQSTRKSKKVEIKQVAGY